MKRLLFCSAVSPAAGSPIAAAAAANIQPGVHRHPTVSSQQTIDRTKGATIGRKKRFYIYAESQVLAAFELSRAGDGRVQHPHSQLSV